MWNSGAPLRDKLIQPWTPKKRKEEVCGGRVLPGGGGRNLGRKKLVGKKQKAQMDVLLKGPLEIPTVY